MSDTGSWVGVGQGPSLSSVALVGSSLRAFFDEIMTNNADLQDPLNYTVTPLAGGDAVTVTGITPGPGTYPLYVDLALSNPTTGGSSYELEVDPGLLDAAGNAMDAGGLTLIFLGFGSSVVALDELGILEALTGIFGEELSATGGFRMTRLTAAVAAGAVTCYVESVLDWPEEGTIGIDGVKYDYTARTDVAITGLTHVRSGATVAGAATDHRIDSTVVDLSREWSALDLLRRAFLVNYAEGDDINVLGRNLGVNRPPIFTDDTQFQSVIKAVAYNPRGTVYGIEQALEALVGAGNYEVYEDLVQYPNTVFIRIDAAAFMGAVSAGRAYLNPVGWDELYGIQDSLTLPGIPLAVSSVLLKPLDELFDFRNAIPSAVTMAPWPGETPITPWTYTGGEVEGVAVTNVPGLYTKFVSATGTVFYRMSDVEGARLTDKSEAEASVLINIPGTATVSGALRAQCMLALNDGVRTVKWGVLDVGPGSYRIGLFAGAAWLGSTVDVSKDAYHEVTLIKRGDTFAELWVDGAFISSSAHGSFSGVGTHQVDFGILATVAGLEVRYKQLGAQWSTVTDYWSKQFPVGSVNVANPTRFDDTIAFLEPADVGKYVTLKGSIVANPQGGYNNGHFLIDSFVGAGIVELAGPVRTDEATVAAADRVTVDREDEFTYPDDLGKEIVITGSALGNNGTYVIDTLLEPGTLVDFAAYDTPIVGAKTNICEVVAAPPFVPESNLDYQLLPVFVTEAGMSWEASDVGLLTGTAVIGLRSTLWINGLVMETHYTDVLSAQLLKDTNEANAVISAGPPVLYEYYPFYLADPLGIVEAYIDDLTAAGVIPEFDAL